MKCLVHSVRVRVIPVRALALLLPVLAVRAFDPNEQVLLADGLYGRGMYEMAAREYASVMTNPAVAHPDAVLFRLGECQRLSGHATSAQDIYATLIARHPDSEFRHRGEFRRAELMVAAGQFLPAVSAFRALLAGNPPADIRASALYYYGFTQDRLLLAADAERAYGELTGSYTNSPFFALGCISLGELREKRAGDMAAIQALYRAAASNAPTPRVHAEALYKLGALAARRRQFAEAAEAFSTLIAQHPADERVVSNQLAIAWAFHNAGRFSESLRLAGTNLAAAAGEPRAEWLYIRGNALRQTDRADEARAAYGDLLREHPASPLAQHAAFELATLLFKAGRHADVVSLAAVLSPSNGTADVRWMLAESHAALKQADAAVASYNLIVAAGEADPRAPLAAYRRGAVLEEAGRNAEAAAAYRDMAARFPKQELAADALTRSAALALKDGRREDAVKDWALLARSHPAFAGLDAALLAQAQAETVLGRDKDAITTLGHLISERSSSPLMAQAHYLRGALLEKSGDLPAAAFHYAAALAAHPDAALERTVQLRRIAVLQRQEKPADAAAVLQRLVESGVATQAPPAQLEWLARWQELQGLHAEAEKAAAVLLATAPDERTRMVAFFLTGRARQQRGDPAGARTAYESALAISNGPPRESIEATMRLGECALALGDSTAATASFSRAAEQASSDSMLDLRARCYHGLGLTAVQRGQWNDASRYFMSVAVLFEDPELTPECLWRAAESFGRASLPEERRKALEELKRRFPDSTWAKKQET